MIAAVAPLRFAVIGDPIAHSRSPGMHAAAYRALDLPHRYEKRRVTADELASAIDDLRRGTYDGYNVTAPHKGAVLALVDHVDPSASQPEAANTLVREANGTITAYNTDVHALCTELALLAPERDAQQWVASAALIFGTGGAARAATLALAQHFGVRRITVRARRPEDPAFVTFARSLEARVSGLEVRTQNLAADASDARFSTVVQATSARDLAEPVSWKHLHESAIAFDVIYTAEKSEKAQKTAFLRASAQRGLRASDGLGMLVRQGALAFERWIGTTAPILEMRKAASLP